jgi:TonB family protein
MKKLVLIACSFIVFHCSFGQTDQAHTVPVQNPDGTFAKVEQMPEFPGGNKGLMEFIGTNLKYPDEARKANVQGKVFASFIVDEKGNVKDVTIAKGIGFGCNEEVKRVIELMPLWKPGMHSGKTVPVRFSIPVNFAIPVENKKQVVDDAKQSQ